MTMTTQTEIERKYDVDESTPLPDLTGIAVVRPAGEAHLEAEYFDTERGDLAANRIVLRRRRGGADEGWHIKLPAVEGRTELHWPLTDEDTPPSDAVDRVRARVRGRELSVIARLRTHRTLVHLVTEDGTALVEFADDVVSATDATTGILRIWREWEVELLDGAPDDPRERTALLDAVEERLLGVGASPSASKSKLAAALGRTDLDQGAAAKPDPAGLDDSSPAAEVLLVAVAALVDDLARIDPLVRADEPDAVHQLRTRIRRLRSLFASYPTVFEPRVTDPLRDRLQAIGTVLGEARDAEVMRDRAAGLLDEYKPVSDDLDERLHAALARQYVAAHARAVEELSGESWLALLDDLDEFVARPALADDAMKPAADVVPRALRKDLRRVRKRAKAADRAGTDEDRMLLLHEVRKAAKRLRYAAEAVSQGDAAVFGKRTRKLAANAEAVHDLLGEHRDSVLMQRHLRRSAGAGPGAAPGAGSGSGSGAGSGAHAFDYGVLHEVERHGAALCLADYPAALGALG
jgi:CHAD domain-containing protein